MLYLVVIPVALLFVPWLLVRYIFVAKQTRELPYAAHAPYLWTAAALWVASQLLPNIPVSPETDTFTMHLTGGVVATVLFLYVVRVYRISFRRWWQPLVALYLFVSGLGVLNELFEFFLDESGLMPMPNSDTWWDLLANTLGAFLAYGTVVGYTGLRKK